MNQFTSAAVLCITLVTNCSAQSAPQISTLVEASTSAEMALRHLQYELILGFPLDSNLSVCVDHGLNSAWMVPEKAETEVSTKATERVRRRLESCHANSGAQQTDMRFAGEFRQLLQSQLMKSHAVETSKLLAKNCLTKSQTQDLFKTCITTAFRVEPSENQWTKWLTLYDRRASFVALALNEH